MAVSAKEFRRIALSFPGSEERSHMDHPDFRVRNKIFATLGYPDDGWGMVKLSSREQMQFVEAEPQIFVPVQGAWGRQGATTVRLNAVGQTNLRRALTAAWRNRAPKRLAQQFGSFPD